MVAVDLSIGLILDMPGCLCFLLRFPGLSAILADRKIDRKQFVRTSRIVPVSSFLVRINFGHLDRRERSSWFRHPVRSDTISVGLSSFSLGDVAAFD